jgi:hypothetical protein
MDENEIRKALNRHFAASDVNHLDVGHGIYRGDEVLEYPQSGSGSGVGIASRQGNRISK